MVATPPRPETTVDPKVRHADFHISYQCNNKCVFCSEAPNLIHGSELELRSDLIIAKLGELRERGIDSVLFTGGEPFAYPHLEEIVAAASGAGMRVSVSTNGTMVDPALFERLAPMLHQMIVSFHAHEPDLHEKTTGNRGGFEKREEFLAEAEKYVVDIMMIANIVLTRINFDSAEYILKAILERNIFKLILLSNVAPEGRALENYRDLTLRLSEVAEITRKAKALTLIGNVETHIFGSPFCTLGRDGANSNDIFWYPRITVERHPPEPGDTAAGLMETTSILPTRKRFKPPVCNSCRCNDDTFCGGIFCEYEAIFGHDELEPF